MLLGEPLDARESASPGTWAQRRQVTSQACPESETNYNHWFNSVLPPSYRARRRSEDRSCTKGGLLLALSSRRSASGQYRTKRDSGVTATSGGYTLSGKAVSDLCRIAVGARADPADGGSASRASAQLV